MFALALALLARGAQEEVEALVSRLGDDPIDVRERAAESLRRIGATALESAEQPEVRAGLHRDDGGGDVVDGLRLHIALETPELRPGGELKVKISLRNMTRTPRRLIVGRSLSGKWLELGSGLIVTAPGKRETPRIGCNIPICGAGASWLEETIPPLGSKSFTLKARLEASEWGDLSYSLGGGAFTLQAPEGPVHRLRVRHETRQAPLELEPGARPWVGALLSNEVELKIAP